VSHRSCAQPAGGAADVGLARDGACHPSPGGIPECMELCPDRAASLRRSLTPSRTRACGLCQAWRRSAMLMAHVSAGVAMPCRSTPASLHSTKVQRTQTHAQDLRPLAEGHLAFRAGRKRAPIPGDRFDPPRRNTSQPRRARCLYPGCERFRSHPIAATRCEKRSSPCHPSPVSSPSPN